MNRKHVVLSAAFLATFGASALAADLPARTMAPPPPPLPLFYNWSGFYAGLNAGYGWSNAGTVTVNDPRFGPTPVSVSSRSGFVGGGQIGYNIQSGAFVGGVEADIQYAGIGSSVNWGRYGYLGVSSGNNGQYFGTVRARAGYAIDRTLLYVTGGLAYGGLNSSPLGGNATSNVGYAVGGGVEYAFTNNWSAKLEALYVNLNRKSGNVAITNGNLIYPINVSGGNGGGVVRVGLNYKFW
jgi:outer membrane immunogenic protein